jgi:hypothetical protein
MKFYLAARYSRRLELVGYRDRLVALGHEVPVRWLNGNHEADAIVDPVLAKLAHKQFALEDRDDVMNCQVLLAFMEEPRCSSRGGRHHEFALADAWGKDIAIIGKPEHVFHHLPWVIQYDDWEACIAAIRNGQAPFLN